MPFQNTHWNSTCEIVPYTCDISMTALLLCFFIILTEVYSENVSPSVRSNLRVIVNTLTANHKHPDQDCENLQLPIQMQLSQKRKTFSWIFIPFVESTSNFKHFVERMIVIANVFPKLQTVKYLLRSLSKKRHFRTRFYSQYVKVFQILPKSQWDYFYYVFHHSQGSSFGNWDPWCYVKS